MKKIITHVDLHALRSEAHVHVSETINAILAKHNPQALGVKPLYDLYRSALDKEQRAFDLICQNDLAAKIAEQDLAHGAIFRGFAGFVGAALHHFDATHRSAAQQLHRLVERYENTERTAFDDVIAANDKLERTLQQAPYEQAVAQLGVSGWRKRLAVENAALNALTTVRYSGAAEKIALAMRITRAATDRYYGAIVGHVENQWMVGINSSVAFVKELNVALEKIRAEFLQ
ncbi:MAG: DUF6261 family protein [Prevotellaceae bacterium]|jgi:hypothetical protein|nr:DUF6261 family protein [Prevotellaceae bacterium]